MIRGEKKFLYLENKIINNIKSYDFKNFIDFESNSIYLKLKLKFLKNLISSNKIYFWEIAYINKIKV